MVVCPAILTELVDITAIGFELAIDPLTSTDHLPLVGSIIFTAAGLGIMDDQDLF